jgi:hypothetical protein
MSLKDQIIHLLQTDQGEELDSIDFNQANVVACLSPNLATALTRYSFSREIVSPALLSPEVARGLLEEGGAFSLRVCNSIPRNSPILTMLNSNGDSLLSTAVKTHNWALASTLLARGANPLYPPDSSALITAALQGDKKMILLLMIKGLEIKSHAQLDDAIPLMAAIISQIHHPSPIPIYANSMQELDAMKKDTVMERVDWLIELDKLYLTCKLIAESRVMVSEELDTMSFGMIEELDSVSSRKREVKQKLASVDGVVAKWEVDWNAKSQEMQKRLTPLLSITDSLSFQTTDVVAAFESTKSDIFSLIAKRKRELDKKLRGETRMESGVGKLHLLVNHVTQWLKTDAQLWNTRTQKLKLLLNHNVDDISSSLSQEMEQRVFDGQELSDTLGQLSMDDKVQQRLDAQKVERQALRRKIRQLERIKESLV